MVDKVKRLRFPGKGSQLLSDETKKPGERFYNTPASRPNMKGYKPAEPKKTSPAKTRSTAETSGQSIFFSQTKTKKPIRSSGKKK
jgi:hypothetical protein